MEGSIANLIGYISEAEGSSRKQSAEIIIIINIISGVFISYVIQKPATSEW